MNNARLKANIIKNLNKKVKVLTEALIAARDHLNFCGYGDKYERECAKEEKLEQKIDKALEL